MNRCLAGIVILTASLVSLTTGRADPTVIWSPTKALLEQLAPATVTGVYEIKPPKGYTLQPKLGPVGSIADAWVGAVRPDGTRPYVMLLTLIPPPTEENKYTLEQVATKMLAGIQRRRTNWKQTSTEQGNIGGIPFLRTYWQGTDIATGTAMHGFIYVAKDAKGFLQLSSQDVEPYDKTALPLAEASVQTFAKHPAATAPVSKP